MRGCAAANALALALVPAALVRGLPAPEGRAVFLGLGRAALIAALLINPLTLIAVGKARRLGGGTDASGAQRPIVIADGPGTCRRAVGLRAAGAPAARARARLHRRRSVPADGDAARVLAAPYHRNVKGNAAMLDVFLGRPDEAAARLAALGVDYVAFCPGAPERHNYAAAAPEGLAAALARGESCPRPRAHPA